MGMDQLEAKESKGKGEVITSGQEPAEGKKLFKRMSRWAETASGKKAGGHVALHDARIVFCEGMETGNPVGRLHVSSPRCTRQEKGETMEPGEEGPQRSHLELEVRKLGKKNTKTKKKKTQSWRLRIQRSAAPQS